MVDRAPTDRRLAVWLFAAFVALYTGLTRGHFYLSDEVQVFQQTRSLWERGDLEVAPNINTVVGQGGRYFAQYGIGQSVLALPFYLSGKVVHRLLARAGANSWIQTFEGPPIGDSDKHWGGEVEIFFVNLFCAFVNAALMVVFFVFNLRLGAGPRWAFAATLILGLATHVAGFGVEFLQHPAEALFLLMSFFFLFINSNNPNWRVRLIAGSMAGMLILVRVSGLILVPALTGYLVWQAFRAESARSQKSRALAAARNSAPFLIPVLVAVLITMAVNHAKWGQYTLSGSYLAFNTFTNSWLVSFYGYLFSPGQSIFIFSPILLLAPIYFRPFARRYPAEAAAILGLAVSYALFYGRSIAWHGQWCFGPRYLMAMIPLLLLPLARWLEVARPAAWIVVIPLVIVGFLVELLHIAPNVSYVYFREGYNKLVPSDSYIFIPQICQLVTHWRALIAFDDRIDMWLVNVARHVALWRAIEILTILGVVLAVSSFKLYWYLKPERNQQEVGDGAIDVLAQT